MFLFCVGFWITILESINNQKVTNLLIDLPENEKNNIKRLRIVQLVTKLQFLEESSRDCLYYIILSFVFMKAFIVYCILNHSLYVFIKPSGHLLEHITQRNAILLETCAKKYFI